MIKFIFFISYSLILFQSYSSISHLLFIPLEGNKREDMIAIASNSYTTNCCSVVVIVVVVVAASAVGKVIAGTTGGYNLNEVEYQNKKKNNNKNNIIELYDSVEIEIENKTETDQSDVVEEEIGLIENLFWQRRKCNFSFITQNRNSRALYSLQYEPKTSLILGKLSSIATGSATSPSPSFSFCTKGFKLTSLARRVGLELLLRLLVEQELEILWTFDPPQAPSTSNSLLFAFASATVDIQSLALAKPIDDCDLSGRPSLKIALLRRVSLPPSKTKTLGKSITKSRLLMRSAKAPYRIFSILEKLLNLK
ncbi:hypothetical protein FF38_02911 [Lucilia cuprina]|uniref:Uncharacterized protein n=1 Tax=Lucilia cuprina TaxID=7375 RepID=A0A0L0CC38_LUCCU|nr:hypothetical protein FF38_02911 [Lucilia cuprina]